MFKAKVLGMVNWKTSLVGVLGVILNLLNDAYKLGLSPVAINAIIILIMGFVSKDSDTTGTGVSARKE